MSRILLHDTTRTVAKSWPAEYVEDGLAEGFVACLHDSPAAGRPFRPSAADRAQPVRASGGRVLVDAASHVDLADTGRDYGTWGLWPTGRPGDFTTAGTYHAHIRRVFHVQEELGAPFLMPGPLLTQPASEDAEALIALADDAKVLVDEVIRDVGTDREDRTVWVTVAGSPSFWSAGRSLDQFVTRITETAVRGWYCVPVREVLTYPPSPNPSEVAGLCRTVHSLSAWGDPVVVANADLLGLPAVAAGATYIGTGWDRRQRCLERRAHAPTDGGAGGSWLELVTLERMAAALSETEARQLYQRDQSLAEEVVPGPTLPAKGGVRIKHHIRTLSKIADRVGTYQPGLDAAAELLAVYGRSRRYEQPVQEASGATSLIANWVEPYERGIEQWIRSEGWGIP